LVDIIKQPVQPWYQQLGNRAPVSCHDISSQIRPRRSEGSPRLARSGSKPETNRGTLRALRIDVLGGSS
jgi:hypothetical protein